MASIFAPSASIRVLLGALFCTPGRPWWLSRRSGGAQEPFRGTPGTLQIVPGSFLGAQGCPRNAPGTILGRFSAPQRTRDRSEVTCQSLFQHPFNACCAPAPAPANLTCPCPCPCQLDVQGPLKPPFQSQPDVPTPWNSWSTEGGQNLFQSCLHYVIIAHCQLKGAKTCSSSNSAPVLLDFFVDVSTGAR